MENQIVKPVRTLFIGTGEFAVPILRALLQSSVVEIVGVVTQPDKLADREQVAKAPPVKQLVVSGNSGAELTVLRLLQPEKLRSSAAEILVETAPELIIVAAYGQMIPDPMLHEPRYGCLNLHGSLLPKLRGAVPVPMAILQGMPETGVTIQQVVKELDAGPILAQGAVKVEQNETTATLMPKLALVGANLLLETLPQWFAGELKAVSQDATQATFCYEADIAKEKAEINLQTDVELAERMVRAFYPWPVAWAKIIVNDQQKRLKIFQARIDRGAPASQLGELRVRRGGKQLFLDLQNGSLELLELQLEGKKRGSAEDYLFLAQK